MDLLRQIQGIVWGPVLMIVLLGTGMYLTIRLKGLQIIKLPLALKYIAEKEHSAEGDVSGFAALCTSLATTIGTGSVVGVAIALRTGGPGSLFWMWAAAVIGMATKYGECCLSVKYRITDDKGQKAGGPMYYIENGMGPKWKWLAKLFAFFGVLASFFGCGIFPQVDSITEVGNIAFHISPTVLGLSVAMVASVIIVGGIQSVGRVAELCVPFMMVFYIAGAFFCLLIHSAKIPEAFQLIFRSAFEPSSLIGGVSGTAVVSVMTSMRHGIARGIFSHESGLGSTPIAAAAAQTNSCVRQGLVCMTGTFFDTFFICTLTGLVILTSNAYQEVSLTGVSLANAAFSAAFPERIGIFILTVSIIFFAFTSIIGWNYYGERCLVYLTKTTRWNMVYRGLYIAMIVAAPFVSAEAIWIVADIANACMALPNLIAVLALSGVICAETKLYFAKGQDRN